MTSVIESPWVDAGAGARGVMVTDGIDALAPWLTTLCTSVTSSSTSMKPPFMRLRCIQTGPSSMARSELQSLANCVIDSPSPPGQSPTVTRVKPSSGCSVRQASTILSSAALLTRYAASPGHGGVSDALTEERYAAAPCDACRCGSAAAVASDAPMALVSKARRQVSASRSSIRDSGPMPVAYTSASIPPRPSAASSMALAARRLVGHVTTDGERAGTGFLGCVDQAVVRVGPGAPRPRPAGPVRPRCSARARWTLR